MYKNLNEYQRKQLDEIMSCNSSFKIKFQTLLTLQTNIEINEFLKNNLDIHELLLNIIMNKDEALNNEEKALELFVDGTSLRVTTNNYEKAIEIFNEAMIYTNNLKLKMDIECEILICSIGLNKPIDNIELSYSILHNFYNKDKSIDNDSFISLTKDLADYLIKLDDVNGAVNIMTHCVLEIDSLKSSMGAKLFIMDKYLYIHSKLKKEPEFFFVQKYNEFFNKLRNKWDKESLYNILQMKRYLFISNLEDLDID